jgi:hypothetical protein
VKLAAAVLLLGVMGLAAFWVSRELLAEERIATAQLPGVGACGATPQTTQFRQPITAPPGAVPTVVTSPIVIPPTRAVGPLPTPIGGGLTPPPGSRPPPGATVPPPPLPPSAAAPASTPCVPPNAQVAQLKAELESQGAKPRFTGTLNGIVFYPDGFDLTEVMRQRSPKCAANAVARSTEAVGRASPLNFTVSFLPPGTAPPRVHVSSCGDDVISLGHDYATSKGILTIYRLSGPAYTHARFASDELQAITIGGRPAVIAQQRSPGGANVSIVMRDDKSMWIISGLDTSRDEMIRVAEGVR